MIFGQHDDNKPAADDAVTPADDAALAAVATDSTAATDTTDDTAPADGDNQSSAASATVITPEPAAPAASTEPGFIATDQHGAPDLAATAALPKDADGLLDIKRDALQQLTPLVGHLNQTPEEKFRTTMMMIQATDDQTLIADAYAAAKTITDEKTRAQALLDIINEINYFTQQQDS